MARKGTPWHGRLIVFASAKGGAGKTTLCAAVAGELIRRGQTVALLDADPLESGGLSQWYGAVAQGAMFEPDPRSLQGAQLVREAGESAAQVAQQLKKTGAVVLADAAGALTRTTLALLQAADLVVIPARPGGLDAARAVEMVELVRKASRAPCAVALNAVTRTALSGHIRAELKGAGVPVLRAQLGQRVAYAMAQLHGTAPAMLSGATVAADEVRRLVDEIGRMVNG